MDNQHRKISGYRELSQEEVDLMNEAKELEAKCLAFHRKVDGYLRAQRRTSSGEHFRQDQADGMRWHTTAKTDIETGFMALVRSIAQPQPRD